jgi:hypothetical protein
MSKWQSELSGQRCVECGSGARGLCLCYLPTQAGETRERSQVHLWQMMECSSWTTGDEEEVEDKDSMPPSLEGEDNKDGDTLDDKAFGGILTGCVAKCAAAWTPVTSTEVPHAMDVGETSDCSLYHFILAWMPLLNSLVSGRRRVDWCANHHRAGSEQDWSSRAPPWTGLRQV